MPFPVVDARDESKHSSHTTSHTVDIPAHGAGDRLVLLFGIHEGASADVSSIGTVNGVSWTEKLDITNNVRLWVYELVATSAQATPITISVSTSGTSTQSQHRIWVIDDSSNIDIDSATGSSINPDPPSLTPSPGLQDYLWLSIWAFLTDGGYTTEAWSTSYGNSWWDRSGGLGGVGLSSCERELAEDTENPGVGTLNGSRPWIAVTIAVVPVIADIVLPFISPVTIFQPDIDQEKIVLLPLMGPTTIFSPNVAISNFIALNRVNPVTIYNPITALSLNIFLDATDIVTIFDPSVYLPIVVDQIQPTTIFLPFIAKQVDIQVGMFLNLGMTIYGDMDLDVDSSPDNDDPLQFTGDLVLANDANPGDVTLTLTATTLTGTVEAGDIITISGETFTITESTFAENNEITISIFPGIESEIGLSLITPITIHLLTVTGA